MNGTIKTNITEKEWNYMENCTTMCHMQVKDVKFVLDRDKYPNSRGVTIKRLSDILKRENKYNS